MEINVIKQKNVKSKELFVPLIYQIVTGKNLENIQKEDNVVQSKKNVKEFLIQFI
jgi:hypothetical protein